MPNPIDATVVHRLFGMNSYLSRFLPILTHVIIPLRQLMQNTVKCQLGEAQEVGLACMIKKSSASSVKQSASVRNSVTKDGRYAIITADNRCARIEKGTAVNSGFTQNIQLEHFRQVTIVFIEHQPHQTIVSNLIHLTPWRLEMSFVRLQKCDVAQERKYDHHTITTDRFR